MAMKAAELYDSRPTLRRGGERRQAARRARGLSGLPAGRADARRHGLREGVSGRTAIARSAGHAHRADQRAAHSVVPRRARARSTQVVLSTMRDIAGRVAFISGGASGIGLLAIARPSRPPARSWCLPTSTARPSITRSPHSRRAAPRRSACCSMSPSRRHGMPPRRKRAPGSATSTFSATMPASAHRVARWRPSPIRTGRGSSASTSTACATASAPSCRA